MKASAGKTLFEAPKLYTDVYVFDDFASVAQVSPSLRSGDAFPVRADAYEIVFQAVDVNRLSNLCNIRFQVTSTIINH